MAGTRTAPTVNGTPNYVHVAVSFIDRSGDQRTISGDFENDATDAEIEALIVAAQAESQASIFEVSVDHKYAGAAITTNAESGQRNSVFDQLVFRAKNTATNQSYSWETPAPVPALLVGDSDVPVNPSTLNTALFNALGAIKAGFGFKSIRYTEKKEINKAVKI